MKRFLAILLALVTVLALCAGCGDKAAGSTGGDTSEAAYKAYLKEYVAAVPAIDGDQAKEFGTLIDAGDYTTKPADMLFSSEWFGFAAMTYDEFVAANGAYTIPDFDPSLSASEEPGEEPSGDPPADSEEPPAA